MTPDVNDLIERLRRVRSQAEASAIYGQAFALGLAPQLFAAIDRLHAERRAERRSRANWARIARNYRPVLYGQVTA